MDMGGNPKKVIFFKTMAIFDPKNGCYEPNLIKASSSHVFWLINRWFPKLRDEGKSDFFINPPFILFVCLSEFSIQLLPGNFGK